MGVVMGALVAVSVLITIFFLKDLKRALRRR